MKRTLQDYFFLTVKKIRSKIHDHQYKLKRYVFVFKTLIYCYIKDVVESVILIDQSLAFTYFKAYVPSVIADVLVYSFIGGLLKGHF